MFWPRLQGGGPAGAPPGTPPPSQSEALLRNWTTPLPTWLKWRCRRTFWRNRAGERGVDRLSPRNRGRSAARWDQAATPSELERCWGIGPGGRAHGPGEAVGFQRSDFVAAQVSAFFSTCRCLSLCPFVSAPILPRLAFLSSFIFSATTLLLLFVSLLPPLPLRKTNFPF